MSSPDEVSYGVWAKPGGGFSIRYALRVFHEIEFVVGESFRRIPHGGIENGGLLFGHRQPDGIEIAAFRAIECEHAFGPAFALSEKDIEGVRQQLQSYKAEPEISELEVLGWFISHSRSDLRLTDREKEIFTDLFPDAWQVTLLAKPEKFKPTRLSFAVREPDGALNLDVTDQSFILPLPARSEREPAPEGEPVRRRRRPRVEEIRSSSASDDFTIPPGAEQSGGTIAPEPRSRSLFNAPPFTTHESNPIPESLQSSGTAPETPALPRPTTPGAFGARYETGVARNVADLEGSGPIQSGTFRFSSLQSTSAPADLSRPITERSPVERSPWAWPLFTLLASIFLATVTGIWFYENYLLPPLTLSISPVSDTIVTVSWPPSQTANAESAILTVWKNGSRQDHMLSQDEMQAGAYLLRNADQSIVQLWTHRWYLNRYGNIRVIMPRIVQPPPLPPAKVLRPRSRVLP